ncbi:MAG: raffinose/stachyose/melibiose transport system substrate-binding protein [Frankiales bacterium]|jgi:raffinose/stachyose/melibiose transport system substrate-binding protein|nr:raffinose/stachyose/melibiose transport system substrate-binding protein [Frankiales bacterium]
MKRFGFAIVTLTVAVGLSGCVKGGTSTSAGPSSGSTGAASAAAATSGGPATGSATGATSAATSGSAAATSTSKGTGSTQTVTIWSWFTKSTMQKAIDQYQTAHPGVKVQYSYYNYDPEFLTALKAAAKNGTLPDIIGLQPGSLTQQYRTDLTPLNSLAAKQWGANWTDSVYPVNLRQMQMGNPAGDKNYYILPQESQVLAIWYNTKIFSKLGLSVPTTLTEMVADAQKIKKAGYIPMYQGAAGAWQNENVFLMIANQLKNGITDDAQSGTTPWTDPVLVNAMGVWKSMFSNGVFQSGALGDQAYPTGAQLFAAGRVGMMALGSWWLQEAELTPPIPSLVQNLQGFNYFQFPAVSASTQPGAVVGGIDVGLGLTKNGAKNPNAFDFMASLVKGDAGKAALVDVNDLPAFTGVTLPDSVGSNVKTLYGKFNAQLPTAANQRFGSPVVKQALDDALSAVAAGQETPQDALAKVEAKQKSSG